jgi:hypothetical protein
MFDEQLVTRATIARPAILGAPLMVGMDFA